MPDRPNKSMDEFSQGPLQFRPDTAYFIVGTYDRATRSVATWLVERGAQHIVFLLNSTGKVHYDDRFDAELESMGCSTKWVSGDVAREEYIVNAIRSVELPVAGVLYLISSSRVGSWLTA